MAAWVTCPFLILILVVVNTSCINWYIQQCSLFFHINIHQCWSFLWQFPETNGFQFQTLMCKKTWNTIYPCVGHPASSPGGFIHCRIQFYGKLATGPNAISLFKQMSQNCPDTGENAPIDSLWSHFAAAPCHARFRVNALTLTMQCWPRCLMSLLTMINSLNPKFNFKCNFLNTFIWQVAVLGP